MEEVETILDSLDNNEDGNIDFGEFCSFMKTPADTASVEDTFLFFDTVGDGKISLEEFSNTISKIHPDSSSTASLQAIFEAADTNKDGFLSTDEVAAILDSLTLNSE